MAQGHNAVQYTSFRSLELEHLKPFLITWLGKFALSLVVGELAAMLGEAAISTPSIV